MNQFEGECRCAQRNESMMKKNMHGNLLGGFSEMIGSMENNNNCKFKLKQNRKFLNQNSLKRLRSLKKNKFSEFILHQDSQEYLPPKAPENRTQYLSSLKKQIADFTAFEKQQKIIQRLNNLNNNNNDDEKTQNKKFGSLTNNTNNALNCSAYANKENLAFFSDDLIFTRRNSNYLSLDDECCGNLFAASDFEKKEKSDFINFHPEDEFLTGSTMKTIVESITKSKNKILSNSLNLDGNQSNLYFSNKENKQNNPSSQIDAPISTKKTPEMEQEKASTAESLVEMNFKISDFIPDLQLDLDSNPNIDNTNENFTEQQTDFFHWRALNKLDLELAENSTKEASSDNTPLEPRSPLSLGNLRENELLRFQNSVEENFQNEKFQFFLLGNKKQRAFTEGEYDYENKENAARRFFYGDKQS